MGVYNKQPKAMVFIAKRYDDQTLLRFGDAYEKRFDS
jgi:Asp-tRNA(Asn)/Glu-tRNA(Gln) amidotransferase A subunit family amidase